MSFPRCGALGAALVAAFSTRQVVASDSPSSPGDPDRARVADVIARAKRSIPDTEMPSVSRPARLQESFPDAEARARAVLARYYTMSAEAQAANDRQAGEKVGIKVDQPQKSAKVRKKPSEVYEDFDTSTPAGPFCKKYVICGGGTAAWAAIEAMLEEDPSAARDMLVITEEKYHPYNRTVLSKELWGKSTDDVLQTDEKARQAVEYGYKFAKGVRVPVVRGKRVDHLDVDDKSVTLSDGTKLHYDKLLMATGGSPKDPRNVSASLDSLEVKNSVSVFRTLDDFLSLRTSVEKAGGGAVVIGGGFLGTELAIALASSSENISLVVAEAGVLYRVLPRYMCEYLARRLSDAGVKVVRSAIVTNATMKSDKEDVVMVDVVSPDAEFVEGSKVVVAVGIDPNVDLARDAGLELDTANGGVRVNDFMMAEPDVFAAGDMASFHDRSLGRRRVEHWDHAVVTGRIAGKNMVGGRERYRLQSMFWSDLTNIGVSFTAVGLVDSSMETISVWNMSSAPVEGAPSANEYTSGAIYYLKDSQVVGTLLWNPRKRSGSLRRARALISAKTNMHEVAEDLLAGLVNLEDAQYRKVIRTRSLERHSVTS